MMKIIDVPTGKIGIIDGDKGKLEFLSIGDYGRETNVKADFLGLNKQINGVRHSEVDLYKKWVITISSQYGCSMNCSFCDVPKVGKGINATAPDLANQIKQGLKLYPKIKHTKRLNIHYARMGEPTWNKIIPYFTLISLKDIVEKCGVKCDTIHPVVSTMMPLNNRGLFDFLDAWLDVKNSIQFNGEVGLQLSINTTDEEIREKTMPYAMELKDISNMFFDLLCHREYGLTGRKIALNFALTKSPIDSELLATLFSPKYFMCKITPMHLTNNCIENGLITEDGYDKYYPYEKVEEDLKNVGFDVLVFVPSKQEDESRITCGNAILAEMEES